MSLIPKPPSMNDPNGLLIFGGRYHVFGQWGENGHAGAAWLAT